MNSSLPLDEIALCSRLRTKDNGLDKERAGAQDRSDPELGQALPY